MELGNLPGADGFDRQDGEAGQEQDYVEERRTDAEPDQGIMPGDMVGDILPHVKVVVIPGEILHHLEGLDVAADGVAVKRRGEIIDKNSHHGG